MNKDELILEILEQNYKTSRLSLTISRPSVKSHSEDCVIKYELLSDTNTPNLPEMQLIKVEPFCLCKESDTEAF